MRKSIVITLFILICFLLQATVFPHFSFGGVVPNLLIVLTASFGFMGGEKTGLVTGFFCGLLLDIFFGEVIGIYAMIYMYTGYVNGKFNKIFFPEDIKLPIILILFSDFVYGLLSYILFFVMRGRFHFTYYIVNIILPEIVYTILVTLFLYPLLLFVHNKLTEKERKRARKFV